jgi:hypothetical protein
MIFWWNSVVFPLFSFPLRIFCVVAVSRLIGDDTQSFSLCGVIYEALRRGESNLAGSELGCPPDARHKGNDHYRADKKRSDLYSVGSLDDVRYRGVSEHDGNQAKSCRCGGGSRAPDC